MESLTGPLQGLSLRSKPRLGLGLDLGTAYTSGAGISEDLDFGKFRKGIRKRFEDYPGAKETAELARATHIPTCVWYDEHGVKIGWEAMEAHENQIVPDMQTGAFFELFKLALDGREIITGDDASLKERLASMKLTLDRLVEDFLSTLFKCWREELFQGAHADVSVQISCAIPSAWKTRRPVSRLSNIIVRAAKVAGFELDRGVRFWPEPVAATVYMAEYQNELFGERLKLGGGLCICDAGGGTVDGIVYDVTNGLEIFKEVVATDGVLCGSRVVNEEMRAQISNRLSGSGMNETTKKQTINKFLSDFETDYKPKYKGTPGYYRNFLCGLIEEDKKKCFANNYVLLFDTHMNAAFDPVIEKIWLNLLRPQICAAREKGVDVHTVAFVGGFSASRYLQQYLTTKLTLLAEELAMDPICLLRFPYEGHTVAEGALLCSDSKKIRRINRCSIGIVRTQQWCRKGQGHPQTRPEPDPITGQCWVADQIEIIMKKGDPQVDPPPVELHEAFAAHENYVEISVPLYSHDEITDDHCPLVDPNKDSWVPWETATVRVDVSALKHDLKLYDEKNQETWLDKYNDDSDDSDEVPGQETAQAEFNTTALPEAPETRLQTDNRMTAKEKSKRTCKMSRKAAENCKQQSLGSKRNKKSRVMKRWYNLDYLFRIRFVDGILCECTIELFNQPDNGPRVITKVLDASWTCAVGEV